MSDILNSAGRLWVPALLGAIVSCGAPMARAADGACPSNHTEVRISRRITPPRVDETKSEAQLATMRFDQSVASDRRFLQLTGLTVAGIAVDHEIRFARSGPDNGPYCVWPSVITIILSTAPTIYIVASHGQCLMTLGLEHERRHVTVNQEVINRYAEIFHSRVSAMTEAIDLDRAATTDPQATRDRIEEKIEAMVSVTADLLYAAWATDQRAVDSDAEYRRISNACPQVTVNPA